MTCSPDTGKDRKTKILPFVDYALHGVFLKRIYLSLQVRDKKGRKKPTPPEKGGGSRGGSRERSGREKVV